VFFMEVSKETDLCVFINVHEGPSFLLEGGELGEKKKLRRMESVAASTVYNSGYAQTTLMRWQLTHGQPLLAGNRGVDWVLDERVFCFADDHLMTMEGKD
jgi:hypothetical protein